MAYTEGCGAWKSNCQHNILVAYFFYFMLCNIMHPHVDIMLQYHKANLSQWLTCTIPYYLMMTYVTSKSHIISMKWDVRLIPIAACAIISLALQEAIPICSLNV